MSVSVTLYGVTYELPTTSETAWGAEVTAFLQALATGAEDDVYAHAGRATAQAIPSGAITIVDFATVALDSQSAITTGAAWKYTVPANQAGIYQVSAQVLFASATLATMELLLYKNASLVRSLGQCRGAADDYTSVGGSTLISLVAGDYIDIRAEHDTGAPRNIGNDVSGRYDYVSIHRVSSVEE